MSQITRRDLLKLGAASAGIAATGLGAKMALGGTVRLAESGKVKPLEYSDVEKKVLALVRDAGPLEPTEVIAYFDKKRWDHFDEHHVFAIMEALRDRFPRKLSHAGPRKYAYHDLS